MADARCDDPFLIIAGVAKAGTTSLFRYLADHPRIAPCRLKEPWYFLPPDLPFPTRPRFALDPLSAYLELFPRAAAGAVKFEASGNYFHYPELAPTIARTLPNARLVVSLRDPIRRLMSQFQMGLLRGWMPATATFDAFVARMFDLTPAEREAPFSDWYMIDEGLYAARLTRWLEIFGRERLLTVCFDDLVRAPAHLAHRVLAFAGLEGDALVGRAFRAENAALTDRAPLLRAAYRRLRRTAAGTRWAPRLQALAESLRRPAARWLTRAVRPPSLSRDTRARLEAFYRDDVAALADVLGSEPPWRSAYAGRR